MIRPISTAHLSTTIGQPDRLAGSSIDPSWFSSLVVICWFPSWVLCSAR